MGIENEVNATLVSVVNQNETAENTTMEPEGLSHQFIYSVYARGISGVFVWAALILTCVQVGTFPTHHLNILMLPQSVCRPYMYYRQYSFFIYFFKLWI